MSVLKQSRRTFLSGGVTGSVMIGAPSIVSAGSLKGGALNQGLVLIKHVSMIITELKSAIIDRYPCYLAESLVNIQNLFLFQKK